MKGLKMDSVGKIYNKELEKIKDTIKTEFKNAQANSKSQLFVKSSKSLDTFVSAYMAEIMGDKTTSISVEKLAEFAEKNGWFDENVNACKSNKEKIAMYFDTDKTDGLITGRELESGLTAIYQLATEEAQEAVTQIPEEITGEIVQTKVTVQPWGTGYDDCLSRIIHGHEPDIKLYGKDYKDYMNALLALNPQIKNPDVIHTGDEITLPVIKRDKDGNFLRDKDGNIQFYSCEEIEASKKANNKECESEGETVTPEAETPAVDTTIAVEQKKVTVEPWGTGKNDCLSRIIHANVPDIKMYGKDYDVYMQELLKINPQIKNPDIIHTGDVITLPAIKRDEQGNILRDKDGNIQFYTSEEIEASENKDEGENLTTGDNPDNVTGREQMVDDNKGDNNGEDDNGEDDNGDNKGDDELKVTIVGNNTITTKGNTTQVQVFDDNGKLQNSTIKTIDGDKTVTKEYLSNGKMSSRKVEVDGVEIEYYFAQTPPTVTYSNGDIKNFDLFGVQHSQSKFKSTSELRTFLMNLFDRYNSGEFANLKFDFGNDKFTATNYSSSDGMYTAYTVEKRDGAKYTMLVDERGMPVQGNDVRKIIVSNAETYYGINSEQADRLDATLLAALYLNPDISFDELSKKAQEMIDKMTSFKENQLA